MAGIELGQKARDRITGFTGTVTGQCRYLSGCDQMLLVPKAGKDGSYIDSQWFDVQRLEPVAGKQVVLDNTRTPGPDKAAPKR